MGYLEQEWNESWYIREYTTAEQILVFAYQIVLLKVRNKFLVRQEQNKNEQKKKNSGGRKKKRANEWNQKVKMADTGK